MMHSFQIQIIEIIHSIRSPLLNAFFIFWNFFDTHWFFIFLIPLIWLWGGWKKGILLSYLFLLSAFTNVLLKAFFAMPRPYQIQDGLQLIDIPGFGFPSGAAQTAMIILILSRRFWKYKSVFFGSVLFFLLLSFSRIYLGVHFFTDIFAGWIVGATVCFLFRLIAPTIGKFLSQANIVTQLLFVVLPPYLISFLVDVDPRVSKYIPVVAGHGVATFCAFYMRSFWEAFDSPRVKGLGYATLITGTGLLYNIQDTFPLFRYGLPKEIFMGLYSVWGLFGAYALCYLIFLRQRRSNKS